MRSSSTRTSSYSTSSRGDGGGANGVTSSSTKSSSYSSRNGGCNGVSSNTTTKTSSYGTRGSGSNRVSSSTTTTKSSNCNGTAGDPCNGVEVRESKSFLQDRSKVSGFGDIMGRMAATDAVGEGGAQSDDQARSLLNRFLGAQVMLTGVESMMAQTSVNGDQKMTVNEERTSSTEEKRTTSSKSGGGGSVGSAELVQGVDINSEFDEDILRKLLDSCDAYEDRRKVRQRLKNISTNAKSGVSGSGVGCTQGASKRGGSRDSSGLSTSSALRSDHGPRSSTQTSSQKSSFSTSSSYSSSLSKGGTSPFNKFQQLDSQQHTTRRASQGGGAAAGGGPLFALSSSLKSSANSIKDVLLQWCQCRTRDYLNKGVKIENFSTSWNDGMAFCALIHHFYPDAFDFDKLDAKNRRYNFTLAFKIADDRAGVMALLDVDDMVMMKKPDWKCVFTYIQSLYKRLKDE